MTGSGFTGVSVPSGDYGVAWTPIGGSPESYTGALPTVANGGIPSPPGGLYPSGWVNPSTGVPYQLGFGWVGVDRRRRRQPRDLERRREHPAAGAGV